MRILMASDLFHPYVLGGGEKQMYEVAKRLAKRHEVHFIMRRLTGIANYEKHEGINIHRVFVPSKWIALESPLNGSFFMKSSFIKGLRLGKFDLYAPQQFFPMPPMWLTSRVRGRPIVPTIHDVYRDMWVQSYGLKGRLMVAFERILLKLPYTKIITVSNSTKQKLIASGILEEKIEVVHNGVNIEEYDRIKVKKSPVPRVIYTGRLVGYKNVSDLIIAFSRLKLDAELYIVGEGPERSKLQHLTKNLGINNKVFFTGFIGEQEKIKLLGSSHVLVLPSSTEGFGISLIEAMAAKTPVIAADISALRELIGGEKTGLLFKLRDVDDLKIKLERILENQELQRNFSRKGYRLVKKKFTWNAAAEKIENIFQSVVI